MAEPKNCTFLPKIININLNTWLLEVYSVATGTFPLKPQVDTCIAHEMLLTEEFLSIPFFVQYKRKCTI